MKAGQDRGGTTGYVEIVTASWLAALNERAKFTFLLEPDQA